MTTIKYSEKPMNCKGRRCVGCKDEIQGNGVAIFMNHSRIANLCLPCYGKLRKKEADRRREDMED